MARHGRVPDDREVTDDVEEMLQAFVEAHRERLSWIGPRVETIGPGGATMMRPFMWNRTDPSRGRARKRRSREHRR